MDKDKAQVSFSKLVNQESISKIKQLISKGLLFNAWEKGKSDRVKFQPHSINDKTLQISCELAKEKDKKSSLIGKSILINFELNGVQFFGKCNLEYDEKLHYHVVIVHEVFKSERRQNFRLLTYPHYEVFGIIDLSENFDDDSKGQILDFSRDDEGQTGLFKNFINILDESTRPVSNENQVVFRIHDISVTGIGMKIGTLETRYFAESKVMKNIKVVFGKEEFLIPKSEIVYMEDKDNDQKEDVEEVKVGLKYIDLPLDIDSALARKINESLRDADITGDFEEFIN